MRNQRSGRGFCLVVYTSYLISGFNFDFGKLDDYILIQLFFWG